MLSHSSIVQAAVVGRAKVTLELPPILRLPRRQPNASRQTWVSQVGCVMTGRMALNNVLMMAENSPHSFEFW